jgi:tryptophan synthase alpha subunit
VPAPVAANLAQPVAKIRAQISLPVAAGFGISNPEPAGLVASSSDAGVGDKGFINQKGFCRFSY